jgi:hypothetical protein
LHVEPAILISSGDRLRIREGLHIAEIAPELQHILFIAKIEWLTIGLQHTSVGSPELANVSVFDGTPIGVDNDAVNSEIIWAACRGRENPHSTDHKA